MEIQTNNGTFFNELNRNLKSEIDAKIARIPSLANTYQNEPAFQQLQNISRNYMRTGNQKFADPFAFKSRLNTEYYDGRNLNILKTLIYNSTRDVPDVKTQNPLKVVDFY